MLTRRGKKERLKELAAPQGFEPRYADPESAVLPLNEGAVQRKLRLAFLIVKAGGTPVNTRAAGKFLLLFALAHLYIWRWSGLRQAQHDTCAESSGVEGLVHAGEPAVRKLGNTPVNMRKDGQIASGYYLIFKYIFVGASYALPNLHISSANQCFYVRLEWNDMRTHLSTRAYESAINLC